jgi:hypothetical protein
MIPAGGNLRCDWLPGKGCYRLTIDVSIAAELGTTQDVAELIATNRERAGKALELAQLRRRREGGER